MMISCNSRRSINKAHNWHTHSGSRLVLKTRKLRSWISVWPLAWGFYLCPSICDRYKLIPKLKPNIEGSIKFFTSSLIDPKHFSEVDVIWKTIILSISFLLLFPTKAAQRSFFRSIAINLQKIIYLLQVVLF